MREHIELEGRITAVLAGTMFRVELDNKHEVLAHISGKMRKRFIRLTAGDRVKLEMSPVRPRQSPHCLSVALARLSITPETLELQRRKLLGNLPQSVSGAGGEGEASKPAVRHPVSGSRHPPPQSNP